MKMFALQLACFIYLMQHAGTNSVYHPWLRITGGQEIPVSDAPFMASLVRYTEKLPNGQSKVFVCGGSIIHERFILTAAHCLEGYSYLDVVRVGTSDLYLGGIAYGVEKFIAHKNYSTKTLKFTYDIGLVKLKANLKFNKNISKIVLADENFKIKPYSMVNITGWGKNGIKGHVSKKLRQVSVKIRPIDDCMYYPWVTDEMICVWSFHKGSCKGDSGGPMTQGNVQIGVVSNGLACGYLPSIFTKVSFLRSWVEDNINQNL